MGKYWRVPCLFEWKWDFWEWYLWQAKFNFYWVWLTILDFTIPYYAPISHMPSLLVLDSVMISSTRRNSINLVQPWAKLLVGTWNPRTFYWKKVKVTVNQNFLLVEVLLMVLVLECHPNSAQITGWYFYFNSVLPIDGQILILM